jgi:hypothetical protein
MLAGELGFGQHFPSSRTSLRTRMSPFWFVHARVLSTSAIVLRASVHQALTATAAMHLSSDLGRDRRSQLGFEVLRTHSK